MRRVSFMVAVLALTAGCIPSIHPIYKNENLVERPEIEGTWIHEQDVWRFQYATDKKYDVSVMDKTGRVGNYDGHLAEIGQGLFLDLYPKDPGIQGNDYYKSHIILAHTFLRVDSVEPTLKMAAMDLNWLKNYLEERHDALAHEKQDNGIIITADTESLQKFLTWHWKTKEAWGDPTEMTKVAQ